jgi:hypothetical protein
MIKFTPAYLKKLEETLKECSYEVRYEKGNFKSGYCLLEAKKVVVINKFSTLESRIQALVEILQNLVAEGVIQTDLRLIGLKNPMITTNQNEFGFQDEQVIDQTELLDSENINDDSVDSQEETI